MVRCFKEVQWAKALSPIGFKFIVTERSTFFKRWQLAKASFPIIKQV